MFREFGIAQPLFHQSVASGYFRKKIYIFQRFCIKAIFKTQNEYNGSRQKAHSAYIHDNREFRKEER
uniref:Uncharacterized protein n=1 Tax=Rhizophora mucronata TaxID=61149 RepID=A0A2P2QD44_RHIMU